MKGVPDCHDIDCDRHAEIVTTFMFDVSYTGGVCFCSECWERHSSYGEVNPVATYEIPQA